MTDLEDIDGRSSLFVGLTPENLARHTATFVRSPNAPAEVAELLSEARRTFVGAASCYDNFSSAALKALQAAEHALRVLTDKVESRQTLGQLLRTDEAEAVLTPDLLAWFRGFALHFRNRLAHPHGSIAMTPGMSEPFVRSCHEAVAEMFPPLQL